MPLRYFLIEEATQEQKDNIGDQLKNARRSIKRHLCECVMKHGQSSRKQYFQGSEEAAEGFKDDNPLANSDNYEVYMSDVSKQKDVVSLMQKAWMESVKSINQMSLRRR